MFMNIEPFRKECYSCGGGRGRLLPRGRGLVPQEAGGAVRGLVAALTRKVEGCIERLNVQKAGFDLHSLGDSAEVRGLLAAVERNQSRQEAPPVPPAGSGRQSFVNLAV